MAVNRLIISKAHARELIHHARRTFPLECCGILTGDHVADGAQATHVVPAENITEGDPKKSSQVDWQTLLRTSRLVRTTKR